MPSRSVFEIWFAPGTIVSSITNGGSFLDVCTAVSTTTLTRDRFDNACTASVLPFPVSVNNLGRSVAGLGDSISGVEQPARLSISCSIGQEHGHSGYRLNVGFFSPAVLSSS